MRHFFTSKRLSTHHKIKIFKTYVETTLLYNSETWTLTKTLEDSINAFHRRLLRIALNYKYPKTICNDKLYNITKQTSLSEIIKKRPDTPAQKALQYHITPHKCPVGRPRLTWIVFITKETHQQQRLHKQTHYNCKRQISESSVRLMSL